jgi:hypothetical protein
MIVVEIRYRLNLWTSLVAKLQLVAQSVLTTLEEIAADTADAA